MIPRARIGADIRHSLAGGFVLIGVVMFVLALTILGISLFGLSSYEAQFYERSRDDAQAFYSALGGIDRAKFVLQRQKHYEDVMLNLPLGDIVYARARVAQSYAGGPAVGDTTGIVDFSGNTRVEIRVLAIHNGERSMVEQTFVPQLPQAIYHRLITAYNGVKVIQPGQAFIDGEVHQFVADTSWTVAPVDAG